MIQVRDSRGLDYRWWGMAWVSVQFEHSPKIFQQRKKDRSKRWHYGFWLEQLKEGGCP